MAGFTIASAVCGAAPDALTLICSRVVQGMASGLMFPQVLGIIQVVSSKDQRTRVIGCYGATIGLATILGPVTGGIGNLRQLHVRNTTLVAVTRAPYEKLAAFRERMGWTFPWYSSYGSDFNYDFHATVDDRVAPVRIWQRTEAEMAGTKMPWSADLRGDWPGISAFLQVDGDVYHTYSTFGRGLEEFHNGDPYLDLTALGRQEAWEEPKGRATPLGLHVSGPNMRIPDEY